MVVRRSDPAAAGAAGAVVVAAGLGLVGAGFWVRRDVGRTLARERILPIGPNPSGAAVASAAEARSLAEFIRARTLESTGGRTYAEIDPYLDPAGTPTADVGHAARDPTTTGPVENPDHAVWIQATTLQTALMQAYIGFRLAELTVVLGAVFTATGVGIALASRRPTARQRRIHWSGGRS
jgi:hypothetical protein